MDLFLVNKKSYKYIIDDKHHCIIHIDTGKQCLRPRLYDNTDNEVNNYLNWVRVPGTDYIKKREITYNRNLLNKGLKKLYNEITYETHPELYAINNRLGIKYVNFLYGMDFSDLRPQEKFVKLYHRRSHTFEYYYNQINNKECYEFMKNNKWAVQAFCAWAIRVGKFFTLLESRKYRKLINNLDYFYSNGPVKFDAIYWNREFYEETKQRSKHLCIPFQYGHKLKIDELRKFINKEECELPFVEFDARQYNKNLKDKYPMLDKLKHYCDDYIKDKFSEIMKKYNKIKDDEYYKKSFVNDNLNTLIRICKNDIKLKDRYLSELLLIKLEKI